MNISEKSKVHIDSCRFCWMCRHICPIAIATGQERNTARARALALSLVERGAEKIEDVVDNLYECALCGACVKECVTGWDPVSFTREARTAACLEGVIPAYVERMLDGLAEKDNVFGLDLASDYPAKEKKTDVLFYVGENARYKSVSSVKRAAGLLDAAGVKYTLLAEEKNSGASMYFLTGKSAETTAMVKECKAQLESYKTVVVYDPEDLRMFAREYKEMGVELSVSIIGFGAYVLSLLNSGALKVKKSAVEYTAQDNFNIARELGDETTLGEILSRIGTHKPFLMCGKHTMLGGSLLMNEYMPEAQANVARARWKNAQGVGATTVVTESPAEYEMLLSTKPEGMRLLSLEEAVVENL